jgi:hypothetical protein
MLRFNVIFYITGKNGYFYGFANARESRQACEDMALVYEYKLGIMAHVIGWKV